MRSYYFFCKLVKQNLSYADFKPVLIRLNNLPNKYFKSSLGDKLLFFFVSLFFPFIICLRLKRDMSTSIFYDLDYSKWRIDLRRAFIGEYAELDKDVIAGAKLRFYYARFHWRSVKKIIKLWWITLRTSIFCLTDDSISWRPLMSSVINSTTAILQERQYQNAYIFSLYFPSSYLTAFILSNYTETPINLVSSNSPLYSMNRYINLSNAYLILCSKYQEEEYRFYERLKWITVKTKMLWGLEEQLYFSKIQFKEATFDIGIYSDASWAREDGIWRSYDVALIKSGKLSNNRKYRALQMIIHTCCILKKEQGYRVKVYLHPHERYLLSNHRIPPPFADELDMYDVPYSSDGENSLDRIFECKIGISSSSTIILDRWHMGLKGLIHYDPQQLGQPFYHNARYFGIYEPYTFSDAMALAEKISEHMSISNSYPHK